MHTMVPNYSECCKIGQMRQGKPAGYFNCSGFIVQMTDELRFRLKISAVTAIPTTMQYNILLD